MGSKHTKLRETLRTYLTWILFTWRTLIFLRIQACSFVWAFHVYLECFVGLKWLETGITFVSIFISVTCMRFQMKNSWKHRITLTAPWFFFGFCWFNRRCLWYSVKGVIIRWIWEQIQLFSDTSSPCTMLCLCVSVEFSPRLECDPTCHTWKGGWKWASLYTDSSSWGFMCQKMAWQLFIIHLKISKFIKMQV